MTPIALDNTLAMLEEPLATMRFRGPPHVYSPGEFQMAADVIFFEDTVRSRRGFTPLVTGMTDLSTVGQDLFPFAVGYARGNATRNVVVASGISGGSSYRVDYCAASPVTLRTVGADGANQLGDQASVGGISLLTNAPTYSPFGPGGSLDNTAIWYGGMAVATYSTGTATVTRGSTSVTGAGTAWSSSMIGGWLTDTAGTTLIGRIASASGTTMTLERPALAALAAAAYKIIPVRNFHPRMAKGRVTCNTASAVVTGARTKFISGRAPFPGATWDLFRAHDNAFIGTVTSFDSDLQVTLTGNAAVACANERYVAIPRAFTNALDSDAGSRQQNVFRANSGGGFIVEEHQGRLYMANRYLSQRNIGGAGVWFSDDIDYEAFDLSEADGDYFIVGRAIQPVTGMASMANGLAIFKSNELWMLYGDDPTTFQLRKVADVGTWDGRSIMPYRGGLVFVSDQGVMVWDGTTVRGVTDHLISPLNFHAASNLTPNTFPVVGMISDSWYVFSIQNVFQRGFDATVNGTARFNSNSLAVCLNLETGALSVFTNMLPMASCCLPVDPGSTHVAADTAWATRDASADQKVNVFSAGSMFGQQGAGSIFGTSLTNVVAVDYWASAGTSATATYTAGPHPYLHTRRFTLPEARYGYWKDVLLDYISEDDTLSLESVYGEELESTFKVETPFPAGGSMLTSGVMVWANVSKRVRVSHRSQFISFRLYPTTDPLTITGGSTGWLIVQLTISVRPMRRGRV